MAQENNSLPKPKTPTFYPNELDPTKKGKAYCLQMVKAQYWYNWNYGSIGNAFGNPRRNDWIENRAAAIGNMNMSKFVGLMSDLKNADGTAATYLNLDLKPITYIPKFVDIAVSYAEKLQYEVLANAINPEAVEHKSRAKWKIWAAKQMATFVQQQEEAAKMNLANLPEFEFEFADKEELDMIYDLTQKMGEELMMELGNELVLFESEWETGKNIKRMLIKDAVVCGMAATETYVDKVTNRVKVGYVDMVNIVLPHWEFRGEFFENPSKIGHVYIKTIAQLRADAGDQFTDEEYAQIAARYANQFGNGSFSYQAGAVPTYVNTDSTYNFWYSFGIPVMTLYWEETDRYKYEDKKAMDGSFYTAPTKFSAEEGTTSYTINVNGETIKKEKTVYHSDVHMYYQAKWIPGTDYIYDWGPVPDMGRNPTNPKYALCPIKVFRVSERSLVDRLLPFEESNILASLKMQNSLAKAVPSGYSININTLKNTQIDGKDFPIKHQVALYEQTGRMVWDSENAFDESGRQLQHPIMQLPSMLENDIKTWLTLMESNVLKMQGVTGINDLMAAETPQSRTAVGTAQIAVAGAQNALTPITNCIVTIQEMNCMDISEKLKLCVQNGGYEGYAPALGMAGLKLVQLTDAIVSYTFGIKVQAMPTEQQRADLKATAQQAVTNTADPVKGGLYYNDYLRICHMLDCGTNLRIVEAFMNYRIKQNLAKMQQQQQANMQAQAQVNAQNIQDTLAATREKINAQAEADMMVNKSKAEDTKEVNASTSMMHTAGQTQTIAAKSEAKKSEEQLKSFLNP